MIDGAFPQFAYRAVTPPLPFFRYGRVIFSLYLIVGPFECAWDILKLLIY